MDDKSDAKMDSMNKLLIENFDSLYLLSKFIAKFSKKMIFVIYSKTDKVLIRKSIYTGGTLVPEVFFSLGATELSRDCESRSDEKKTSGTNG